MKGTNASISLVDACDGQLLIERCVADKPANVIAQPPIRVHSNPAVQQNDWPARGTDSSGDCRIFAGVRRIGPGGSAGTGAGLHIAIRSMLDAGAAHIGRQLSLLGGHGAQFRTPTADAHDIVHPLADLAGSRV